jgi:hypothetical protein
VNGPLRIVPRAPLLSSRRACRQCGCTEANACYRPDKGTCWWAEADLCSHCAQPWKGRRVPVWTVAAVSLLTWVAGLAVMGLAVTGRRRGWW